MPAVWPVGVVRSLRTRIPEAWRGSWEAWVVSIVTDPKVRAAEDWRVSLLHPE